MEKKAIRTVVKTQEEHLATIGQFVCYKQQVVYICLIDLSHPNSTFR